jgi:hypothetical protein
MLMQISYESSPFSGRGEYFVVFHLLINEVCERVTVFLINLPAKAGYLGIHYIPLFIECVSSWG